MRANLGEVLREMRTREGLTGRQLADAAQLSHTQISRIETGATAAPNAATIVRLARALGFNHRPLLVLAGHLTGEDARAELTAMVEDHRGMFDFWEDMVGMTLEEMRSVLADPNASVAQMAEVAKELALWANAELEQAEDDREQDPQEPGKRELLDTWRLLNDARRGELLTYAQALRHLQALDFSVANRRLTLQDSPPLSTIDSDAAPFSEADLRRRGFEGFVRVRGLRDGISGVPGSPGVYAVVRRGSDAPRFLPASVGGRFKDRDPSVDEAQLRSAWVESETLYFGKADSKRAALRTRLGDLAKFANGVPAAHWGGRLLWQLADHEDLLVCWLETVGPADVERALIDEFVDAYGAMPFANMRRPGASR